MKIFSVLLPILFNIMRMIETKSDEIIQKWLDYFDDIQYYIKIQKYPNGCSNEGILFHFMMNSPLPFVNGKPI